jgi:hypothetical protein
MIDLLKPLIKQFMPFAQKQMGFNRPPKLFLRQNSQNSADPLGKTGFYDPANESITIYITDRHPKDVMRSLAHELMHHTQKCNGDFDNLENVGEQGYAQNDSHLRSMEIQAYQASIVFRDWEDSIKGTIYNESLQKGANENMSIKNWKNEELKTLITEQWGFSMNLDKLNEAGDPTGVESPSEYGEKKAKKSLKGEDDPEEEKKGWEGLKEENNELFEQATATCKQRHELLGDKAVRQCIEEEMTRLISEGCPFEEEEDEDLEEAFGSDTRTERPRKPRLQTRAGEEEEDEEDIEEAFGRDTRRAPRRTGRSTRTAPETGDRRGPPTAYDAPEPSAKAVGKMISQRDEEDDEELEERHKPPNVTQGREPGRRKKNINTGQRTIDEERIREMAKAAIKHFRANSKR